MGGKVAIKEKVKTRPGVPQRRDGKAASAPTSTRAPVVKKTEVANTQAPVLNKTEAARTHAPVVKKAGGKPGVQVRPRVKVARVRYPSPEQRLAAAFRRMYRGAVAYFRETRLEMRKVVWPSRRETVVYTLVVVAATAIVGLLIWVFDIGLSAVLRTIIR